MARLSNAKRLEAIQDTYKRMINGELSKRDLYDRLARFCAFECYKCSKCFVHGGSCKTKLPSTVPCLAFEERDKDAFINDLTEEKEERDLMKEAYKIQKEKGWLTVSILQLRLKVNNKTANELYQKVVS